MDELENCEDTQLKNADQSIATYLKHARILAHPHNLRLASVTDDGTNCEIFVTMNRLTSQSKMQERIA